MPKPLLFIRLPSPVLSQVSLAFFPCLPTVKEGPNSIAAWSVWFRGAPRMHSEILDCFYKIIGRKMTNWLRQVVTSKAVDFKPEKFEDTMSRRCLT